MSEKCECTMSISILGDGCRYCEPQGHIDTLNHIIREIEEEMESLEKELRDQGV